MSLNNGFYESVINKLVDEEIQRIKFKNDKYIDTKEIDKEETSSVISNYMASVINKSLNRISGEDKQNKQVEVCNKNCIQNHICFTEKRNFQQHIYAHLIYQIQPLPPI